MTTIDDSQLTLPIIAQVPSNRIIAPLEKRRQDGDAHRVCKYPTTYVLYVCSTSQRYIASKFNGGKKHADAGSLVIRHAIEATRTCGIGGDGVFKLGVDVMITTLPMGMGGST